jgi:RNA polymerase sigma-70 factor (ECF subfamily)
MHQDAELIARCQRADASAFDAIVARYKTKIYHYLYRMTGNAEDADDLTQEVFIRMYTNIGKFRAEASLSTWLFRIAGNLAVDRFRRTKNSRRLVTSLDAPIQPGEEEASRDVPDMTMAPEVLVGRRELADQIESALAKLPAKLRSAVILFDVEGMSYDEIAGVEGIPLGTVKSRIFNARVALRDSLRPYLETE